MTKFKVFTKENNKSVPINMIFVKDDKGWLFLENHDTQWYVNHTNTFDSQSTEDDTTVIKSIVKQIKINKKMLTPNEGK